MLSRKEIKTRRKGFIGLILALAMAVTMPGLTAMAAETAEVDAANEKYTSPSAYGTDNKLMPGDIIKGKGSGNWIRVVYKGMPGVADYTDTDTSVNPDHSYTVQDVKAVSNNKIASDNLEKWSVVATSNPNITITVNGVQQPLNFLITLTAVLGYRLDYFIGNTQIEEIGDGGDGPYRYTYGVGADLPNPNEGDGYAGCRFDGWSEDKDTLTPRNSKIGTTETGDKKLYARFIADITYNLNGGTNSPNNPATYVVGIGTPLEDATPPTGKEFVGWYVAGNGTDGQNETKKTSITKEDKGPITLNAKYKNATYKVTYVLNGGTNAQSNPAEYTYGTGVASFADATKADSEFGGWYADPEFKTKKTSIGASESGDVTLYAKFTEKKPEPTICSITYELDGGTNAAENPATYTVGTGVEKFADATKEGYDFGGWFSDKELTKKVESIGKDATGDKTLYAKFTQKTDNDSDKDKDKDKNNNDNDKDKDKDKNNNDNDKDKDKNNNDNDKDKDKNKQNAETYTITYVLNGGTNAENNPSTYTKGTGVASFSPAKKDGYDFGGWFLDEDFKTAITSISATDTGNKTLYAKFTVSKDKEKKNGDIDDHVHDYEWKITKEATEEEDGTCTEVCKICGAYGKEQPISACGIFCLRTAEKIKTAKPGETVKITTSRWLTFNTAVMQALAERKDVTLEVSYLSDGYKGTRQSFTIPAGQDTMKLLDKNGYAGFHYLDNLY